MTIQSNRPETGDPESEAPQVLGRFGAAFDHPAVAARRIRDLLPIYRDLLGGTFVRGGDNTRVGYRAIQLAFSNGSRIELMEPLEGSHFFDSFFERRGSGGLHHVTFKVDSIEQAVEAMKASGYSLTGLHLEDVAWREVFLHPREAYGTLVQLAQGEGEYAGPDVLTLEGVLAGLGSHGNGTPSP
ncbi:MAG TPA: VOC family protein [Acidimicrobiales bacterium]|nr:VOC family protein [Acidimicrobiales bacterium]